MLSLACGVCVRGLVAAQCVFRRGERYTGRSVRIPPDELHVRYACFQVKVPNYKLQLKLIDLVGLSGGSLRPSFGMTHFDRLAVRLKAHNPWL